jgi:uncharacterized protein (DUF427 family)
MWAICKNHDVALTYPHPQEKGKDIQRYVALWEGMQMIRKE